MTATSLAALDVNLADLPTLGDDLLLRLNDIREAHPVYWSDIQQGWFITRHRDVSDAFMSKLPLSNVRLDKIAFAAIPENEWPKRIPLLTGGTPTFANMTDPPYHTRLRIPMNSSFTPKKVERIRDFVSERVHELLDEAGRHREFDFIDLIGRPLTASVIMKLMGMPQQYLPRMKGWVNAIVNALGTLRPSVALLEAGEQAMREMNEIFTEELNIRRKTPEDDFFTMLAKASEGENGYTPLELLGTCVNALLAGHESTASTMALGMAALVRHPEQKEFMLAHPERSAETVAEISRFVGMSACQTRIVADDFEWHGKRLRKGQAVYLWTASANRDPRVFRKPDELDLRQDASESLVFGRGIHFCLGHLLAKLELGAFFNPAFARFSWSLRDRKLPFTDSYSFRTLSALTVAVTPV